METEPTAPISTPEAAASESFAESSSGNGAESQSATQENGERPLSAGQKQDQATEQQPKKELSRYERTKRQRAEFQKREVALKQREEQLAQIERERTKPKKPEYSLADLKQYRQSWEEEGKFDLVEKADLEIKRLEQLEQQEQGQQSFQAEWHQAESDLAQNDPDFGAGKGTRLDKQLQAIMGGPDGQIYRQHPRGIVAAYHRAKMELLESDHKDALGKIQQLESELKRLTGLTSIGGSAPGRVGTSRVESLSDFSKLSSADMLKHLQTGARKGGGMPWL